MTDDSIEAKALAMVNELFAESGGSPIDYAALFGKSDIVTFALCRAIEQHQAFKQDVSDAVSTALIGFAGPLPELERFIITKPKPDPLAYAMIEVGLIPFANQLRAALDDLGFEIREKGQ